MTALQAARVKQETFVAPHVERGDVVAWFAPGGGDESLALVHRTNGDGTLCLTVIPNPGGPIERAWLDQTRQCVLHKDDPIQQTRFVRYGAWDLTDGEKARRAEMAQIKSQLKELSKVQGPKSKV